MATCTIDAGVRIEGLVEVEGDVCIEGRVDGRVVAGGVVTIATGASCRASVRCPRLKVIGELIGNAVCTDGIDVAPGARVVGDLRAPDVQIGSGADVDGRVDLLAPEPRASSALRQSMGTRGLGPVRPQVPEFARKIPVPPRPSGRIRVRQRGDET